MLLTKLLGLGYGYWKRDMVTYEMKQLFDQIRQYHLGEGILKSMSSHFHLPSPEICLWPAINSCGSWAI